MDLKLFESLKGINELEENWRLEKDKEGNFKYRLNIVTAYNSHGGAAALTIIQVLAPSKEQAIEKALSQVKGKVLNISQVKLDAEIPDVHGV